MNSSLEIKGIPFYDAPADIEGSPYWVDLWTEVNGYMIGLQVKPNTYNSASISIYSGKAKLSQKNGYKKFTERYCGKVFIAIPEKGQLDGKTELEIVNEYDRLKKLPKGKFSYSNY